MKSKKQLILLVLKILESQTDSDNPLTQKEIMQLISLIHPCDRKTVGRNIKFLKEIGYPITKTGKGFYLDKRVFTVEEIDYILEAILAAPNVDSINKVELCNKTRQWLSKLLKRTKNNI
jgi:biotin operon repressor